MLILQHIDGKSEPFALQKHIAFQHAALRIIGMEEMDGGLISVMITETSLPDNCSCEGYINRPSTEFIL